VAARIQILVQPLSGLAGSRVESAMPAT